MKAFFRAAAIAALLSGIAGVAAHAAEAPAEAQAAAQSVQGRWDAVLVRNGQEIPFRLDLEGEGNNLKAVFYDGWRPYDGSTGASYKDGKLVLLVDHYLTTITARVENGQLVGDVKSQSRESSADYGFKAVRYVAKAPASTVGVPQIAGSYLIPLDSPSSKGEKAFRFVVEQKGAEVAASILRIDGDTGAYTGEFKDGKWTLSHFDGSRPGVITVTPKADGTLEINQDGGRAAQRAAAAGASEYSASLVADGRAARILTAYKPDVYKAKGLPAPEDFLTHTTLRDPNEKFTFKFPDGNGKLVSSEDPQFKGKVVLAIVTGTWCPNCHDEAQYLVELDKKYRDKGLAIVALSFEEPEQQGHLKRAKAFIKQYGVKYTYLYPGAPAEMWEKVPQLTHLDTWPATVFIGKDGKIDAVHSGFASPAAGDYHVQLKKDFDARIEKLLAAKAPVTVAEAAPAAPTKLATAK